MVGTEILWQVKADKPFITVAYGCVFQEKIKSILTGGEDGIIRVYAIPDKKSSNIKPVRTLETKCGPLFHVRLHDVIRLVSQDLIAADSRGSVAVFCNGQLFMRTMPEKAAGITTLQINETSLGHLFIITGNEDGIINCFNAFSDCWKIRLRDVMTEKNEIMRTTLSVTCILATSISSPSCPPMEYIVVADSDRNLHFIQEGSVLLTITAPSVVNAMVVGHFLHYDESSEGSEKLTQIALGCSDGSIWICVDFEVQTTSQYAHVKHPITHLHRLSPIHHSHATSGEESNDIGQNIKSEQIENSEDKLDILLCAGHFPSLLVLREGKILTKHPLSDWANSICKFNEKTEQGNSESADCNTVLVGCQDSTLRVIRVN